MVCSTVKEWGENGLLHLGVPVKGSYMGDTVAKKKSYKCSFCWWLMACNSVMILVKCGSPECVYTQSLKCAGGELNCEGPTQGSSDYPKNAKIKFSSFPLFPFICTTMYLWFSVWKIPILEPIHHWGQNFFLVHKMNGSWSKKCGHNFLLYIVFIIK